MSDEKLRRAGAAFKEAGLSLLEAIEDPRLRKSFSLRMRCVQAAVGEFVDHVIQANEALQNVTISSQGESDGF